jgi:hypothetical protein
MKKALLLFSALCIATLSFAQLPFATLTHNDSVRVFHGIYALQQAHAAAVNGDVINLSSGVFDAVNITKAVTIRGAGMFADNATGRQSTSIRNGFTVAVTDTVNRLELIGLYFISGANMTIYKAYHPQFIKCRFQTVHATNRNNQETTDITYNATFINCIVQQWYSNHWNNYANWSAHATQFYNSVVLNYSHEQEPGVQIVNSIVNISNSASALNNKTILNSILYNSNSYNDGSLNGYTVFNSIGINDYRYNSNYQYSRTYFDLTNMSGHYLYNYPSNTSGTWTNPFSMVFQTFRGTYSDGMSMALNDNIATSILGEDSTQVGIYGGYYPWDPSVSNPLIGHCTAARRTDAQGMLQVDIEIINNDEEEPEGDTPSDFD